MAPHRTNSRTIHMRQALALTRRGHLDVRQTDGDLTRSSFQVEMEAPVVDSRFGRIPC